MPRGRAFQSIRDILEKMGADSKWNRKQKQYALWNQWDRLLGTEVAKRARPLRWSGNTLVVAAADSCWLQELRMRQDEIVQKIRAAFPEVPLQSIRWVLDDQAP